jgi:VanZ family protein
MLRKKVKLNKHYLPAFVVGILIFVGASISTSSLEDLQKSSQMLGILLSEYSLHFFGFGLFAWLLCYGFDRQKKYPIPYHKIGFYAFSYGLFIELYQIALPHRHFSVLDLAVDCLGIGAAMILFKRVSASRRASI